LVRAGNPTAAGRRLSVDHNTVRRRVSALEDGLQTRLFSSRGPTYDLTVEGDCIYKYAQAMEALTIRAEEAVATSDLAVSGTVRVGAPHCFGSFFLASRLARWSLDQRALHLKVFILATALSPSNRDAEVTILMNRPKQMRQIVRKLTDYTVHLYASPEYLAQGPALRNLDDLKQHRFIGYMPDLVDAPQLDVLPQFGEGIEAHFESTSISAQLEATVASCGLCVLPDFVARDHLGLQQVLPDEFSLTREYWLAIHPEMINLARVRAVIDFIVESVRSEADLFCTASATVDLATEKKTA